jgi:hypothetical protein
MEGAKKGSNIENRGALLAMDPVSKANTRIEARLLSGRHTITVIRYAAQRFTFKTPQIHRNLLVCAKRLFLGRGKT